MIITLWSHAPPAWGGRNKKAWQLTSPISLRNLLPIGARFGKSFCHNTSTAIFLKWLLPAKMGNYLFTFGHESMRIFHFYHWYQHVYPISHWSWLWNSSKSAPTGNRYPEPAMDAQLTAACNPPHRHPQSERSLDKSTKKKKLFFFLWPRFLYYKGRLHAGSSASVDSPIRWFYVWVGKPVCVCVCVKCILEVYQNFGGKFIG